MRRARGKRVEFVFELDEDVMDKVTGFRGKITGRSDFLTGCRQYLLEGMSRNGDPLARWIDEDRLEPAPEQAPADVPLRRAGGPALTPPASPGR